MNRAVSDGLTDRQVTDNDDGDGLSGIKEEIEVEVHEGSEERNEEEKEEESEGQSGSEVEEDKSEASPPRGDETMADRDEELDEKDKRYLRQQADLAVTLPVLRLALGKYTASYAVCRRYPLCADFGLGAASRATSVSARSQTPNPPYSSLSLRSRRPAAITAGYSSGNANKAESIDRTHTTRRPGERST